MNESRRYPAFLTYKEFAYETRRSTSAIRADARTGKLRIVRFGRAVRIPRTELDRIAQSGSVR